MRSVVPGGVLPLIASRTTTWVNFPSSETTSPATTIGAMPIHS
jgi:hypothetical protein